MQEEREKRGGRREGIIFPSPARQGWQLSSWTPPCPWPGAAGQLRAVLHRSTGGACRSISAGRRWPELARAPTASLQVRLKATCSRDTATSPCHHLLLRVHLGLLHIPMADQPWLYRTQALKVSEPLKQEVLLLPRFWRNFHTPVHPNYTYTITPVTLQTRTRCLLFPIPRPGCVTYSTSHYPTDRQGKQTITSFSQKLYLPNKNKVLSNCTF